MRFRIEDTWRVSRWKYTSIHSHIETFYVQLICFELFWLQYTLLVCLLLLLSILSGCVHIFSAPNILFVLVDDTWDVYLPRKAMQNEKTCFFGDNCQISSTKAQSNYFKEVMLIFRLIFCNAVKKYNLTKIKKQWSLLWVVLSLRIISNKPRPAF